jgi:glycosyltransferase involved in cell wall biosynthesis
MTKESPQKEGADGIQVLCVTVAEMQIKHKKEKSMLYVAQFTPDFTKSFSGVAFNNVKALQCKKINFEVRSIGNMINWSDLPPWLADSKDYFTNTRSDMNCAVLQLLPSDILKSHWADPNKTIAFTVAETSLVPKWLASGYNESLKGLLVPSEHTKRAFKDAGVEIPIRVVPHALEPQWLRPSVDYGAKSEETYVFGNVGYWNSRKNQETLLRAYINAFPKPRKDVALLLKTYKAQGVESLIHSLAGEDRSDVWVYNESWSESQMLWGYSLIDCYVSPHKGEGFGLTLANAAAQGKPVLYTGYSAPKEWLGEEGHYTIEYDDVNLSTEDVTLGYSHLEQSLRWAEPKIEHLTEQLKMLSEKRPKKGFETSKLDAFRNRLSWDSVGSELVSAVEDIMQMPLPRLETKNE